jgi:hypothetical protein
MKSMGMSIDMNILELEWIGGGVKKKLLHFSIPFG